MRLRSSAVGALGAWASLALGACTAATVAGELSPAECADEDDNDGDGPSDCEDPDCHAFDVCNSVTRRPTGRIADAVMGQAPSDGPDAGVSPPPLDPLPSDEPEPQASPPPAPDVPTPPELPAPVLVECDPACVEPEMCVNGLCLGPEVVFGDSWQITQLEAAVPRRVEASRCLDGSALWCQGGGPNSDFLGCGCPPDLRVQVWVDNPPEDGQLAGVTDVMEKADAASWSLEPPISLLLLASGQVVLVVVDQDGEGQEPIFECSIPADPEALGQGVITCGHAFKTDLGVTKTYELRAHVSPVSE